MTAPDSSRRSAAAAAPAISDPMRAALGLRARGRPEEALAVLSRAGEFSPDLCTLRGDLQVELGLIQEAVASYSTVLALDGGNAYAHYNLAQCLGRLKRWEPAAEVFRKLLAHDSHRDDARIGLGNCLLHMTRFEEALACFDACWSEAARVQALFGKAVALQILRRFDEAESSYERVLALDPKAEEALANLVAMSLEVFDLGRIYRYAVRLLESNPQSAIALQGLVLVSVERQEDEAAARYFSLLEQARGHEVPPGNSIRRAVEYTLNGEVVDRLNQGRNMPASSMRRSDQPFDRRDAQG